VFRLIFEIYWTTVKITTGWWQSVSLLENFQISTNNTPASAQLTDCCWFPQPPTQWVPKLREKDDDSEWPHQKGINIWVIYKIYLKKYVTTTTSCARAHYNNTLHTVGYNILQQTVWYNTRTIVYISMVFSHIIGFLDAFYYWITLPGDKEHLKMIQWAKVHLISQ
jgi:hypothetical protein